VLFIVVKLVKTVVKWVIIIALAAAVWVYGANYLKDIKNDVAGHALQVMAGGASSATYKKNADGSYTVTANNITITGRPDSKDVKVTFLGQTVTLPIDDVVQKFIDTAKKAQ
jgi:hypothetical protein